MRRFTIGKVIIYLTIALVALLCVLPLLLVVIVSFTPQSEIVHNGYTFFPQSFTLEAYQMMFKNSKQIVSSYGVSIFVTVVGTVTATAITGMASFSLANPAVYYRNRIAMFFFVTMVFNGGMVPWYIICKKVGLTENIFALIIPSLIFNPFSMFLIRNYMRELPVSLMESAKLDGANDAVIAFKIYFPLSLPILATVALFYSIAYWNDWWNSIMLVSDAKLYPVQYFLMKLKSDLNMMKSLQGSMTGGYVPSDSLQMATAVITIGPIILFYPFLQKYIVKGLVIGSVKG